MPKALDITTNATGIRITVIQSAKPVNSIAPSIGNRTIIGITVIAITKGLGIVFACGSLSSSSSMPSLARTDIAVLGDIASSISSTVNSLMPFCCFVSGSCFCCFDVPSSDKGGMSSVISFDPRTYFSPRFCTLCVPFMWMFLTSMCN